MEGKNESKHTPGPWKSVRGVTTIWVELNGGFRINLGNSDDPEAIANAKLIASAPALLEENERLKSAVLLEMRASENLRAEVYRLTKENDVIAFIEKEVKDSHTQHPTDKKPITLDESMKRILKDLCVKFGLMGPDNAIEDEFSEDGLSTITGAMQEYASQQNAELMEKLDDVKYWHEDAIHRLEQQNAELREEIAKFKEITTKGKSY